MKLLTIFVSLTITLSAYAQLLLIKRDDNNLVEKLTLECRNDILNSEYIECEPEIDSSKYKEYCPLVTSEKCQTYYKDPAKYYPNCKDIPEFKQIYNVDNLDKMKESYRLACQTDEKGELCPYTKKVTSSNGFLDFVIISKSDIERQCESKKCSSELLDTLKNSKERNNKRIVDMLEECTSDSHKLKSHNFLLMTLSLFLLIIVY